MRRTLVWAGLDAFRAEIASVELAEDRLFAHGTQIGVDPEPYRLEYELETGARYVTDRLSLQANGRSLELRRGDGGALDEVLDCDLAFSPLTNAMPVLRHGIHRGAPAHDFVMAWVSVPDLTVHRSEQRYEPVRPGVVRFVGRDPDFVADLELDDEGFVVRYPGLAERAFPPIGENRRE